MKSNNLIIILLIIIIILIIGIGYSAISNQNKDKEIVNNTTNNNTVNKTLNPVFVSNNDTSDDVNQTKHYDDWQKDYETGKYDEFGSPIYRSVMSTSGGQYEPGIYEAYWSENGLISEVRIG